MRYLDIHGKGFHLNVKVYIDTNDWWIGAYRGPNHWYICPLPLLVIRVKR